MLCVISISEKRVSFMIGKYLENFITKHKVLSVLSSTVYYCFSPQKHVQFVHYFHLLSIKFKLPSGDLPCQYKVHQNLGICTNLVSISKIFKMVLQKGYLLLTRTQYKRKDPSSLLVKYLKINQGTTHEVRYDLCHTSFLYPREQVFL